MQLSEFSYILPQELIALKPQKPRDHSRLMVIDRAKKTISHHFFYELPELLSKNDVLVLNRSKVIPARIIGNIEGKKAEILLVEKIAAARVEVMTKPGKKFQENAVFRINERLFGKVKKILKNGHRIIEFKGKNLEKDLEKVGHTPLPPYLRHSQAMPEDYQTIYAKEKGSIAAPTAGLHFTEKLIKNLNKKSIQIETVLLHVGPGTFQTVREEIIENHSMHAEKFQIDVQTAKRLNEAKKREKNIIAIGTTSARVLESSYEKKYIPQTRKTNLFIYPGYEWKALDGLITNFHLPCSTLLMLVCAFAGKDLIMKAYQEAIKRKYRFFSFGDAMLVR